MTISSEGAYEVKWYPFDGHPDSDSCWSLSVGPDGRIYAAACCERTPGGVVELVRYDAEHGALEYLFDLDRVVADPGDSGRATQCKIHYSFAPSMGDGVLYMATHLSGPPIDRTAYSPWASWHDAARCFRGAALVAYDTRAEEVLWWDTIIPKEGCRCLLHDEERGKLYALSYPRDHFIVYDLKSRAAVDVGRIGSVNAQALFLDRQHRVWTSSDEGRLVRYDPGIGRLERSPYLLPHDRRYQTGWHSVLYDVAPSPDGECVYASTWIAGPRLMRIWPNEGEWGRVEDLGPATQDHDLSVPVCTFLDHCGGLVFGGDGCLYYGASQWSDDRAGAADEDGKRARGFIHRLDPDTLRRETVAELRRPGHMAQYVSRGAVDGNGDLFFGHVGAAPVGLFKVTPPASRRKMNAHLPLRMWG